MKKEREFHTVRGYQMLNSEKKSITSSMEDYLEMIYRTCLKEGFSRTNQLAEELNVRPSSATKVVQKLKELELVDYEKYGVIVLTKEGKILGEFLLRRHQIIEEFLKNLGIKDTLLQDTEMIEHDVSFNALKSIYLFNEFLAENPEIMKQYEKFKEEYKNIDFSYPSI